MIQRGIFYVTVEFKCCFAIPDVLVCRDNSGLLGLSYCDLFLSFSISVIKP